jgi:hypothetical protein
MGGASRNRPAEASGDWPATEGDLAMFHIFLKKNELATFSPEHADLRPKGERSEGFHFKIATAERPMFCNFLNS